jgi:hypothetical protein
MLALLDETDQRRIGILETLMQQTQWITIGELAQRVGASERTIHSDLVFIKNEWGEKLQLDVSLKNGVQLGCRSAAMLHDIQIDIFKSAVAPRFLRDLFFFSDQNIEFYTRKLFISKSTLVRLIPKVNACLSAVNVTIERCGLTYRLSAQDEQEFRKLFSVAYVELNREILHKRPTQIELNIPGATAPVCFPRIRGIIRAMLQQSPYRSAVELVFRDDTALTQMVAFYLVSLIRESQGFHIQSTRPLEEEISSQDLQYLIELFPGISSENLKPIHELLMKPFLTTHTTDEAAQLDREITAFYERVFAELHATCPPETLVKLKQAMEILYHYVLVCPAFATQFIRHINGFVSSVQDCHPRLYSAFQDSLSALSGAMGVDLHHILPDMIVHACFIFPALGMATPPKRIAIVSDSGIEHADFIANFIRSIFNGACYETVQVTSIPYMEAMDPAFESHYAKEDIFITTDPNLIHQITSRPVLLFHEFPTDENFGQLYDAIYRK